MEKMKRAEDRLNDYGKRIDDLEQRDVRWEYQIKHLCEKIDGLTSAIKWAGVFAITTGLGFIIWFIQNLR